MIPPPFQIIPVLNSYIEGAIERHNQPRKISIREKVTLAAAMRPSRASEQARKRRGPYMQIALTHCNRIIIHTQLRTDRFCGRAGLWETGQLGGRPGLWETGQLGGRPGLWETRKLGGRPGLWETGQLGGREGLWETGRHCCKVSDEAAFCLIQRPYISKTLLTRRISPRGSP